MYGEDKEVTFILCKLNNKGDIVSQKPIYVKWNQDGGLYVLPELVFEFDTSVAEVVAVEIKKGITTQMVKELLED